MNAIENSILKTVIYFDTLSYPLREKEIFENLQAIEDQKEVYFFEFQKRLEGLKDYIEYSNGLWFLRGKKNLVDERKKREIISRRNFKKLERIINKINFTPFIKGIFVSGSLSIYNSTVNSDIDLLIVVKKGRIFTVRFLLTILLDLMKERRHKNKKSRKICLNHYLTDESLEVKYPSLYNAYNYLHLLPVVNKGHVFERFRKENKWMKKYILFTGLTFRPPFTLKKSSRFRAFLRSILSGTFGEFIERKLKGFQIRRRDKNYPKGVIKDRIILEDNVIELHPDSPEERILGEYERKISQIIK